MMLTPSIKTLSRDLDMLRIEEDTPHGETSMVLPELDRLRLVQDQPAGTEVSMVLPGLDRLRLVEHSTAGGEDVFARLQKPIPDFSTPGADHNTRVRYRLFKELKRLVQDPPAGISVVPPDFYECNIMLWNVVIAPHSLDSPWEGGAFKLTLHFSEDYPVKPPMVQFVSQMFHPNISADGNLSLNSLLDQWTPINDAEDVLKYIQSLICHPNPKFLANSEAFSLYFSENRLEFNRKVRIIVDQSWIAD